jgi:hypothetical protein
MLVLAANALWVSSINTKRRGSSRPGYFFHCARRRAIAGRFCSMANSVFLKRSPLGPHQFLRPHQPPDRHRVHHHAKRGQLGRQRRHRQIRHRCQTRDQERTMRFQRRLATPAHSPCRRRARCPMPLRPLYNAGNAHTEQTGHFPARSARRYSRYNTFPKIVRIRSCHPMPTSNPAIRVDEITRLETPKSIQSQCNRA